MRDMFTLFLHVIVILFRPMPQIYVMNADGSEQKQLTHNAGFSGVPMCSPDGSKVLFQVNENPSLDPSHSQIYVMNADGSQQRNLSKNAANDQVPRWSAKGAKILFFSDISGKDQLYVMDADGSHRPRLTNDAFNNHTGVWSHDGKKIAFTSDRDGIWEIYTADADGSHDSAPDAQCSRPPASTVVSRRLADCFQPARRREP